MLERVNVDPWKVVKWYMSICVCDGMRLHEVKMDKKKRFYVNQLQENYVMGDGVNMVWLNKRKKGKEEGSHHLVVDWLV